MTPPCSPIGSVLNFLCTAAGESVWVYQEKSLTSFANNTVANDGDLAKIITFLDNSSTLLDK